ncbi:MAG TPA: 23S rRNA (uracil(1939)-C(5))-methyltransferase RlmD [Polyangiaceae bacterium]|nr:23S rRNA (uracil(1939)-C(5))-methyltransferase RlmD [Polyangiaceae bacterium]
MTRPGVEQQSGEAVTIECLVPGGAGMARRDDGSILFVPGAYPQDVVEVHDVTRKGGTAFAGRMRVLAPSPQRVAAPCAFFETCGGCDLMAIDGDAQKKAKLDLVQQALRRTGGLHWPDLRWHASPDALHYRERIRLHVKQGQLGFFSRASHVLVPVTECLVARPELNDALSRLLTLARDQRGVFSHFEAIDVRVVSHPGHGQAARLLVHLLPRPKTQRKNQRPGQRPRAQGQAQHDPETRRAAGSIASALPASSVVRLAGDESPPVQDHVAQGSFIYSRPGLFSQVNAAVNQLMIEHVIQVAQQAAARTFLDLYCGSGNFSVPLMARGLDGVGVEFEPEAVDLARRAAVEQSAPGFGQGQFIAADSQDFASQELMQKSYDLVIVDPPRAGAKQILEAVVRATRSTLVMVSCDPVTLARDLKQLMQHGLAVQTISCFDMFPHTHHVETIAVLHNPPRAGRSS